MAKKSRTKGAAAENEVARILRENTPWVEAERNLDQCRLKGRHGIVTDLEGNHHLGDPLADPDLNGVDLINTGTWALQVKRYAQMPPSIINKGLQEAQAGINYDPFEFAACIHRSDRQPWRVTTDLEDLVNYTTGNVPLLYTANSARVSMGLVQFCIVVTQVEARR